MNVDKFVLRADSPELGTLLNPTSFTAFLYLLEHSKYSRLSIEQHE